MNFERDRMPRYELVFIISPEVTNDEVPEAINRVSELVSKVGEGWLRFIHGEKRS